MSDDKPVVRWIDEMRERRKRPCCEKCYVMGIFSAFAGILPCDLLCECHDEPKDKQRE